MTHHPGSTVGSPFAKGGYRLIRQLAAGTSGDLFLADHRPSGLVCVLRRLPDSLMRHADAAELYLRGVLRQQQLVHEHVNTIHVLMRRKGRAYIVSDYTRGHDLAQVFRVLDPGRPLPPALAVHLILQLSYALDSAHRQLIEGEDMPLIHGSLWPTNVLVNRAGQVVVTDFGSWIVRAALGHEAAASGVRLYAYRSPEQVRGEAPGACSDIFCVSLLLFQLLSGQHPFIAPTAVQTLQRLGSAELGGTLEQVPRRFRPLLARCLACEPHARVPDMGAYIAELLALEPEAAPYGLGTMLAEHLDVLIERERSDSAAALLQPHRIPTAARVLLGQRPHLESLTTVTGPAPLGPVLGTVVGGEVDVPTPVSPPSMTQALAALSRKKTDPVAFKQVITSFGLLVPDEKPTADGRSSGSEFVVEGGELTHTTGEQAPQIEPFWAEPEQPTELDRDARREAASTAFDADTEVEPLARVEQRLADAESDLGHEATHEELPRPRRRDD